MTKTNKKGMLYLASITLLASLIAVFTLLKGEDKSLEVDAKTQLIVDHQLLKTQFNEVYLLENQPEEKWQYLAVDVKPLEKVANIEMTTGTNETKCVKIDVEHDLKSVANKNINGFAYVSELTGDVIEKTILEDNSKQYFVHNGFVKVYQIPVNYNTSSGMITVYSKKGNEVKTMTYDEFKNSANDINSYKQFIVE